MNDNTPLANVNEIPPQQTELHADDQASLSKAATNARPKHTKTKSASDIQSPFTNDSNNNETHPPLVKVSSQR